MTTSSRKRWPKISPVTMLMAVAGMLALVSVGVYRSKLVQLADIRAERSRLQAELAAEQQRSVDLRATQAYLESPNAVENEARKLGYGFADETRVIVVTPAGYVAPPPPPPPPPPERPQNWRVWWELFFATEN
ncbi:MAG: hypothetical protein DWI67_07560 [Chloroflexi bacterium]|nr:MAG: hypothetical protein DWI64_05770 [Chloroflexota bacterium]RLT51419.1 MAG: hypothetical protein DWI67_07560 [Chloroflexota bacterium]